MSILAVDIEVPFAISAETTQDTLQVDLSDGRTIIIPIAWYPRLSHASDEELNCWRLIGHGQGIHWDKLDEDISVESLLMGRCSGESQSSLKKWLQTRKNSNKSSNLDS